MSFLDKAKQKAKKLKSEITAIYYAWKNPELGFLPKICIALTLAYALSPIDLIPDFIPVLGYLDDLIILPLLLILSLKLIPPEIMEQARIQAEKEPVALKKNRFTAGIIVLFWTAIIFLIIRNIIKK